MNARAAAAVCAVVAAGCGVTKAPPPKPVTPAQWRANARQLVQQLRADIYDASLGGSKGALRNISDMTALLVAYTDLGGCGAMAGGTGAPARIVQALDRACVPLERAAALFARAARGTDAHALAAATRETRLAEPALVRALVAINGS